MAALTAWVVGDNQTSRMPTEIGIEFLSESIREEQITDFLAKAADQDSTQPTK